MKTNDLFKMAFILLLTTFFISCSNDDEIQGEKSKANFYITDAPIDNTNVKGVFITVADVKVNGVSIEGFSKTTIDLMQYRNGLTKLLGSLDLSAGTYSNISLILDNQTSAGGNSPGSYVLMADGSVKALQSTSNKIDINDSFEILSSSTNEVVLDFDIRKALVSSGTNTFKFVTMSELSNSIRVVNKAKVGVIKGSALDAQSTSDKIIVYAYKKGTYNNSVETNAQGSGVMFANAVNSSVVNKTTGSYELNFLEQGDYELRFVSYSDSNNDGEFEFKGVLQAESTAGLNLNNISVGSNLTINVLVTIVGF